MTLGLKKMNNSREREANKTARMDIVVVVELLNVDGVTPKSAMKNVFLLIMRIACMYLDGLEPMNYIEDFM